MLRMKFNIDLTCIVGGKYPLKINPLSFLYCSISFKTSGIPAKEQRFGRFLPKVGRVQVRLRSGRGRVLAREREDTSDDVTEAVRAPSRHG